MIRKIITGIFILIVSSAAGHYFYTHDVGIALTICIVVLPVGAYVFGGFLKSHTILTTPVNLTESEIQILINDLSDDIDECMKLARYGKTQQIHTRISIIRQLQKKLDYAVKDLNSINKKSGTRRH